MLKLSKILFPTDFSECANQALMHAVYLAKQFNAQLHMLHAVVLHGEEPYDPWHHATGVEEALKLAQEIVMANMTRDVELHGVEDLQVTKAQRRGISVSPVILEYAAENNIDLIVMGTHGRRGLGHLFLGSVAEEVIRSAPCAVLTIRETESPKSLNSMKKVLVPVDFSEHSKNALGVAKQIASLYDTELQLLHVVQQTIHPAFYATGKTSIFDLVPDIERKSTEALKKLYQEAEGPAIKAEFFIIEGHAATEIIDFADKNLSDLIVISTHGLTGLDHLLLGSTTEKVVRRASCPVLTLKRQGT